MQPHLFNSIPPTPAGFVLAARSLLGTPYLHQGRDPRIGIDCLGLLECSAGMIGILAMEEFTLIYNRLPDGTMLREGLSARLITISSEEARAGDILMLRFARDPSHVGVLAGDPHGAPTLIHAFRNVSGSISKVIEEPIERWRSRIVEAFRIPSFAE